jgi:hypothetical protein
MPKGDYAAFRSLDPFFAVVMEGLSKFVDGEHYFDTLDDDEDSALAGLHGFARRMEGVERGHLTGTSRFKCLRRQVSTPLTSAVGQSLPNRDVCVRSHDVAASRTSKRARSRRSYALRSIIQHYAQGPPGGSLGRSISPLGAALAGFARKRPVIRRSVANACQDQTRFAR